MSKDNNPSPLEALGDLQDKLFYRYGIPRVEKRLNIIKQALTRLEELEKKHTPMKPYWEHAYICNNCSNDYVEKSDNYCTNCGQALDWTGDNKPLQNMESGE
jgi:rRNA maturation endonuclease Nob1